MNNNKKNGNKFEQDFCDFLSKKGFYVIYVEGHKNSNSQPCDIIAILGNIPILMDCKILENKTGTFPLSRIEQNQRKAYERFKECGNTRYILAILWNEKVYYVDMGDIDFSKKSINLKNGYIYDNWEVN